MFGASRFGAVIELDRPASADSSGGDDHNDRRSTCLRHLAVAVRLLSTYGMASGRLTHVSVRDPERPERLWMNPSEVAPTRTRVSDLIWIDRGALDLTGPAVARPGLALHVALHNGLQGGEPDTAAVVCAPSAAAIAWAMHGRPVPPVTIAVCELYERHQIGLPPTAAEPGPGYSREIAKRFAGQKAMLVPYLGLITVGRTIGEALWRALVLDRAADIALRAKASGELAPLPFDVARLMRGDLERLDPDHEFGPLYAETIEYEPSVLDAEGLDLDELDKLDDLDESVMPLST